jgi:hypothetical protein
MMGFLDPVLAYHFSKEISTIALVDFAEKQRG